MVKKLREMPADFELDEISHKSGKRGKRREEKEKEKRKNGNLYKEGGDFCVESDPGSEVINQGKVIAKNDPDVVKDQSGRQKKDKTELSSNPDLAEEIEPIQLSETVETDQGGEADKFEGQKEGDNPDNEGAYKTEMDSLNKELAEGLVEFNNNYDMEKNFQETDKMQEKSEIEIKNLSDEMRCELEDSFNDIRIKFIKFNKKYGKSEDEKDKDFIGKLEGTINGYAKKIRGFDALDIYSREKLEEMNQLNKELQDWLDKDWILAYEELKEKKTKIVVKESTEKPEDKGDENPLLELDHKDLHGAEASKGESGVDEKIFADGNLSEIERVELASLIEEKLADIDSDYEFLMKRFHDFREDNKGETEFHKTIFRKTVDINEKKNQLRKKIKQEAVLNQNVLHDLIDLDKEIVDFIEEDWDKKLKKFKGEIEFNESEKIIVEKLKEVANKFIESDEAIKDFNLDDFPKGRLGELLEIQAMAFFMKEFKNKGLFEDREEEVAEFIVKNRK